MSNKILFVSLFLTSLILLNPGFSDSSREELILYQGQVEAVPVNGPARIVIDRPEVIDVIKVTDKEIVLTAKNKGEANFSWEDNFGEHSLYVKVYLEDMEKIKERIDILLDKIGFSQLTTKAADSEGKVILLGEVKDENDIERIFTALGELKDKVANLIEVKEEEAMVEIAVQVLELQKGKDRNLGFELPTSLTVSEINSSLGSTVGAGTGIPFGGLFPIRLWDRTKFSGTLNLLIEEGKARVLSRPRLACRSGKEAELLVGGEVPIMTTTASGSVDTPGTEVEYKEYGIKLKVRPEVVGPDKINLVLSVEVSEVGDVTTLGSTTQTTAKAYPLTKRVINTELSLKDSEVISIGGLIKQKTQEDLKKFPWLADIPILGAFFRSKQVTQGGGADERGDTELFITLSPKIIPRGDEPAVKLSSEELLEKKIRRYHEKSYIPAELESYASAVQKMILRELYYPELASGSGWSGSLVLSLNISYEGRLREARVSEPSGNKMFDTAALKAAENLSYPPFYYYQIDLREISLDIPVVYKSDQ